MKMNLTKKIAKVISKIKERIASWTNKIVGYQK